MARFGRLPGVMAGPSCCLRHRVDRRSGGDCPVDASLRGAAYERSERAQARFSRYNTRRALVRLEAGMARKESMIRELAAQLGLSPQSEVSPHG